jgi:hypothetical protein
MSRLTDHEWCRQLRRALMIAVAGGAAIGCMPSTVQLQTPHYTLSHPDFWKVKKTATKDGDPTVVVIPQYGAAVIDEGSGSMASKGQNYDAVTADVEVRLYSWPDDDSAADPTLKVGLHLKPDPELALPQHWVIPDNPPECGVYPKKYTIFGVQQTPADLVKRPGWRTIVVGGRANGYLLGVVARVEFEPDMQRNCHNLSNMRVQLQNLLDGVVATGPPAPAPAPPAAAPPAPPEPPKS